MRRSADALFQGLGVRMAVGDLVRGLSMADQQLIEIANVDLFESQDRGMAAR